MHLSGDSTAKGAKKCIACHRSFKEADYVTAIRKKKPGRVTKRSVDYGYEHVQCEPPTPRLSRKAIKESVKPLLEATQ